MTLNDKKGVTLPLKSFMGSIMRCKMKTKGFALIVLPVFVFAILIVSFCYASKVKVVEGLIESVTSDYIKVRGEYYNISDVPLLDSSGKKVSKERLRIGRKVEIFFQGGRITSILIHEYMVE
jgi:hypothetical protein